MVSESPQLAPTPLRATARWVFFLLGNALIALLAEGLLEFVINPIGLGDNAPPWIPNAVLATNTLFDAAPSSDDWTEPRGYEAFTSEFMNSARPNADWRYVSANEPSTGPLVVSVNPIDKYQWGAAAKSQQNQNCYLILTYADKEKPKQFGGFKYAAMPPSAECKGALATPERVTEEDWPYLPDNQVPARQEPWATLGFVVAGAAAVVVVISRLLRGRLGKAARWTIHVAGMILVIAGLWMSFTAIA